MNRFATVRWAAAGVITASLAAAAAVTVKRGVAAGAGEMMPHSHAGDEGDAGHGERGADRPDPENPAKPPAHERPAQHNAASGGHADMPDSRPSKPAPAGGPKATPPDKGHGDDHPH